MSRIGGREPSPIARYDQLSNLLDTQFSLPGVPFRFGVDGVVGLVPFVGDSVTGVMGAYALKLAHGHQLPARARFAIGWNVLVDWLIGSIPLIGDLFDFAFHAHRKNYRILAKHFEREQD